MPPTENLAFPAAGPEQHVEIDGVGGNRLGHLGIGIGLGHVDEIDGRARRFLPRARQGAEDVVGRVGVAESLEANRLALELALVLGFQAELTDPFHVRIGGGDPRSRDLQDLHADIILRQRALVCLANDSTGAHPGGGASRSLEQRSAANATWFTHQSFSFPIPTIMFRDTSTGATRCRIIAMQPGLVNSSHR